MDATIWFHFNFIDSSNVNNKEGGIKGKYLAPWLNAFVSFEIIIRNGCYTSKFQLFHTRKQNLCIERI